VRVALISLIVALCSVCGVGAFQGTGDGKDARAFVADDHYRLKSASDVRVSPDGSTAAFVERFVDAERRNRSHIWLVKLADGSLRRLTAEEADDSSPR